MSNINDRCPLQSECERKHCDYQFHERDCRYYQGNARLGEEIPDQSEAMEAEWEARMSDTSVLADPPTAPMELEPVIVPGSTGSLVWLPVDQLYPHPDNPRKDLGDLTELADSIKATSILQNLTVVPGHILTGEEYKELCKRYQESPSEAVRQQMNSKRCDDGYTVIIGHRRLAAAKLAGLTEVLCVVTEMDQKEQIQTMLLENMARSNLTTYEEAQGFQMMLDLGSTVKEIAEKSGLSKTTVRQRVKLLKLDADKFKKSEARGATLQDYLELEKIEDPELKNRVLDAIGTNNFHTTLNNAIDEEKNRKYIAEVSAAMAEFATLVDAADYSMMQYVTGYDVWNKKKKVERPDDADAAKYYYTTSNKSVSLYREKIETDEDAAAREEQARQQAEFNRREAALKNLAETAYKLRLDFIKNYSKAKKNLPLVIQFAGRALCEITDSADLEILAELLDIPCDLDNEEFDMEAYNAAMSERPEYTLLATAYAAADYEGLAYYRRNYRIENGHYNHHLDYEANERLDFLYFQLIDLGYEMSDEEKALQDGTHELFHRGNPIPKAQKTGSEETS